jgi:hypothetical protein
VSVPVWEAVGAASTALSGMDIINLFAAAFSIVLAIVALVLSIFFFVQGNKSANRAEKSAQEISSSVAKLEKLFESLYSDTFTMMRDTVTDMRRHVWKVGPESIDKERDAEVQRTLDRFQASLLEELGEVSKRVGLADSKIADLRSEMQPVVERTLTQQEEAVRTIGQQVLENEILDFLQGGPSDLATISDQSGYEDNLIVRALFDLRAAGKVWWDGRPGRISRRQPVMLIESVPEVLR